MCKHVYCVYMCICMCKCRCLNANVCVLKANFISFMLDCSICIFIRYFTLLEVSPASRLVESPCDPFLRFHMHTHHRPAGLAEALLTGKEIVKESVVVFSMQFSCEGLHHSLPKTMLYSGAFLPSVKLGISGNSHCVYQQVPTLLSHA